jgi:hypothetical protein
LACPGRGENIILREEWGGALWFLDQYIDPCQHMSSGTEGSETEASAKSYINVGLLGYFSGLGGFHLYIKYCRINEKKVYK